MSAFVVSSEHVDVILAYGLRKPGDLNWLAQREPEIVWKRFDYNDDAPTLVGRMLMQENVASVCARYEQDTADEYERALAYTYTEPGFLLTAPEVLKAIACLDYQSCEHDGWEGSEARRFLDAVEHNAIAALWTDAMPSEWDAEAIRKARQERGYAVSILRLGR